MAPDAEALRAILKQYIGPAYDRALRNTGEPEAAKEATRRAMELLKRACMDGVEPTKALVLRITDDCCNEKAFFNRQVEVERQKLQEGDGAEAAPEPAPKGKALLGGKRFQEAAEKPAESHIKAAPVKAQAKAERAKPKPAAECLLFLQQEGPHRWQIGQHGSDQNEKPYIEKQVKKHAVHHYPFSSGNSGPSLAFSVAPACSLGVPSQFLPILQ